MQCIQYTISCVLTKYKHRSTRMRIYETKILKRGNIKTLFYAYLWIMLVFICITVGLSTRYLYLYKYWKCLAVHFQVQVLVHDSKLLVALPAVLSLLPPRPF